MRAKKSTSLQLLTSVPLLEEPVLKKLVTANELLSLAATLLRWLDSATFCAVVGTSQDVRVVNPPLIVVATSDP
jgi:hypothetical protein